jgi:transposase-like protein
MTKIPQGEWSAIAERYSQGESISSIARHYGCTAPAIHYILKRNKERTAGSNPQPAVAQTPINCKVARPAVLGSEANGQPNLSLTGRRAPTAQAKAPSAEEHRETDSHRNFAPLMEPVRTERSPAAALQPKRGKPQRVNRASALTAGLDAELRSDAEVAIQAFRSSFDAALAENSPVTRERLRQTASDLMRAAARTTIVLDRLSAGAKRAVQ